VQQTWVHLAHEPIPAFIDVRHSASSYPAPEGRMADLLQATLDASHLVLVCPVYWFSLPTAVKAYLDHWSGLRVPGLDFKARMAGKPLYLVSTGANAARPSPPSTRPSCAPNSWPCPGAGPVGKGGAPDAVQADTEAVQAAAGFLQRA
jgi:hypothetical protein